MYGQEKKYRVGGGCKSTFKSNMNTPNHRRDFSETLKRMDADRERRCAEQEAWLKTPEGIAYVKAEAGRVQRQIEEEGRRRDEERKQVEHAVKCSEVYNTKPAICATLSTLPGTTAIVFLKKDRGRYLAWTLLRCSQVNYPELPVWHIADAGRFGMKLFFDWPSVQRLFAEDPLSKLTLDERENEEQQEEADRKIREADYLRNHPTETAMDFRWYEHGNHLDGGLYGQIEKDPSNETIMSVTVTSVVITGYAASGKSAKVKLA